jgi:hypothetical protein
MVSFMTISQHAPVPLCHPALEPVMSSICNTVLVNNHCDLNYVCTHSTPLLEFIHSSELQRPLTMLH